MTALAVVAFSEAGMAKTKEVKLIKPVKKETKKVTLFRTTCDTIWIYYYQSYIDTHKGTAGSSEAVEYADRLSAKNGC